MLMMHVPLFLSPAISTFAFKSQLFGGIGVTSALSLFSRYYKRLLTRDFVLRIDFDVDLESFIVIVPPSSFR